MTECVGAPAEEFAERYLNGSLPEAEMERFENHYFACDTCHELLLVLEDVRSGLKAAPAAGSGMGAGVLPAVQPMRIVARREAKEGKVAQLGTPRKFVMWGSVAAAILVAAVLTLVALNRHAVLPQNAVKTPVTPTQPVRTGPAQGPKPENAPENALHVPNGASALPANRNLQIAAIADVRLPGYQAPELRGPEVIDPAQGAFTAGMKSYSQGDCAGALAQFSHVPDSSRHGVTARLYSGLCHYKAHEMMLAQASFERVVAAGDTPQLETAEYYLAQTLLLRCDATMARMWLRRTVALHGDYQSRAQAQLARLVHVARQPWTVP